MSLLTYKDVRPWAKAIREAVLQKKMPPWFADPAHGEFSNDRRLPKAEIEAIVNWVDAGRRRVIRKTRRSHSNSSTDG